MGAGFAIRPMTPAIGAEVTDLDLAHGLDDDTFASIHAAFLEHHVLVFRDQHLTRQDHKTVGRRFGELHVHPSRRRCPSSGQSAASSSVAFSPLI